MKTQHTPDQFESVTISPQEYALLQAAPDLLRFARAIEESVQDALRPGSPDTFMSLVRRLQDYRSWSRAAIAKAEGREVC